MGSGRLAAVGFGVKKPGLGQRWSEFLNTAGEATDLTCTTRRRAVRQRGILLSAYGEVSCPSTRISCCPLTQTGSHRQ